MSMIKDGVYKEKVYALFSAYFETKKSIGN